MRKSICFVVTAIIVSSCGNGVGRTPEGQVNPDNKKEWKLVWEDDFDYKSRKDLLEVWKSDNQPHTHILCSRWEENVEVGDGVVRLVNRKENRGGQEWTSGSLTSYKDFQYGYFECRYKFAAAPATNSSFWLAVRDTKVMPEKGHPYEIDINEGHYPSEYTCTIHDFTKERTCVFTDRKELTESDPTKEYHTYGLAWDENELVFYIDRQEFRRVANDICHSPTPIRLSEAILKWAGEATDAIDGTFMEIDYVKVYAKR